MVRSALCPIATALFLSTIKSVQIKFDSNTIWAYMEWSQNNVAFMAGTRRLDKRSADVSGNIRIMILVDLNFCQSVDSPPPQSVSAHHDRPLLSSSRLRGPRCLNLRKNQRASQRRECGRTHGLVDEPQPSNSPIQRPKMKRHNRRSSD
jgi:hypothetical protein